MKRLKTLTAILAVSLLFLVPATAVQAENTHSIDLEASNSEYLSISDTEQAGLDITGDMTIEADIKLKQLPSTAGTIFHIVSKDDRSGSRGYAFIVRNTSDNQASANSLQFYWFDGDGNVSAFGSETSLTTGVWYHVSASIDVSTPSVNFCIDNSSISTVNFADHATSINNSSADFTVGSVISSGMSRRHFDGLIDNVRIWNKTKTTTEIHNNQNVELNGSEDNLISYWKFNDSLLDTSGYNNTLTNHGASFSTEVPFTGSTETGSCSCTNRTYFETATNLIGSGSQDMILGTNSSGVPIVCVNQVGGDFLDEFTFFDGTWTPVSVTQILETDKISVIAYDINGDYEERILDISTGERTPNPL